MIRKLVLYFGVVYLATGVLGLVPALGGSYSLTTHQLLNLFDVNLSHNLLHVAVGAAAMVASRTSLYAVLFAKVIGIVLIGLGVIGIFSASILAIFGSNGLLPLGGLDVLLHLASGAVAAYFGFTSREVVQLGA